MYVYVILDQETKEICQKETKEIPATIDHSLQTVYTYYTYMMNNVNIRVYIV